MHITEETILATRQWFASNAQECIDDVISGKVKVTNVSEYVQWQESLITEYLFGKHDHTLTFKQRAIFIQTGECHALLPK